MADSPNFRKPVDAPRLDVYLSAKLDWSKVTVPQAVQVIDQRSGTGKKAATSNIKGDVFDMATGKPIANAQVTVEIYKTPQNAYVKGTSGTSDAQGQFAVVDIPSGHCRIIASAPGFAPRILGNEEFKDGDSRKLLVELSKSVKVTGTITDPTGNALIGITVRTHNNMGIDGRGYGQPEGPEVKTDESGRFTLDNIPNGYGQIWVHGDGFYQLDSLKLRRFPDENALTVQMVATGVVRGKIVDAKGKPAGGGFVSINVDPPGDPIGKWGGSMNVEADGVFQFENVPPGNYTVSTKPQFPGSKPDTTAQHITVNSGKITEVTVPK